MTAGRRYASGLLLGVAASIALLVVVGLVALGAILAYKGLSAGDISRTLSPEEYWAWRDTLVGIGGGAAGALVSVLLRLHGNAFVDPEAAKLRAAFYRVALEWFFTAAVLFLIKGGLLDVFSVPAPKPSSGEAVGAAVITSWCFWGAVGFLAGFNERWVRDLIVREPARGEPSTPEVPRPVAR